MRVKTVIIFFRPGPQEGKKRGVKGGGEEGKARWHPHSLELRYCSGDKRKKRKGKREDGRESIDSKGQYR